MDLEKMPEASELSTSTTSTDLVTQTDVSYKTEVKSSTDQLKRLDYLMGSSLVFYLQI